MRSAIRIMASVVDGPELARAAERIFILKQTAH
jgi:hypothetical protein